MRGIIRGPALALALVFALPLGGSPAGAATATPEEKAAAIVGPSVVYIEMEWSAWVRVPGSSDLFFDGYVNSGRAFKWSTRCSGFVVNPNGYIVTAGHCVDEGEHGARGMALEFAVQWLIDNGWARQRDFNFWLNEAHLSWGVEGEERDTPADLIVHVQRGVAAGGMKTGEVFPARVVEHSTIVDGDVALLKIEASDLPSIQIATDSDIAIGTNVLSVGYPGSSDAVTDASYEPTFKDGQINSKKTREGGLLPVYEMSAALSGGMSGGPTVDLSANVVGVNSFNIVGETEAFNFITPSSLVTEMLARNGVEAQLGPTDEAYRAGLTAYFSGDYQTAVDKFTEVLGLSPTHQQAQEFKVLATKEAANDPQSAEPSGSGGGFPIIPVAGAVVVLVVLAAGAFMLRSRRRPAVAAAPVVPQPAGSAGGAVQTQARLTQQSDNGVATAAAAQTTGVMVATEQGGSHFCSSCGHAVAGDVAFCSNCGHRIDG
ncbi:MAG: trypsin-like peptidase domain-containing protein [Actinomycetota bacterium]